MWLPVQTWLPNIDHHFECCDLLQRGIVHDGTDQAAAMIMT
jgi:hypothetical protein